jgi:hypothetical protein
MSVNFKLVLVCIAALALQACRPAEDPARVTLRERLVQRAPLTPEELTSLLNDLSRTLEGKVVKSMVAGETHDLSDRQRYDVLGMLTDRQGVFDEGLRTSGNRAFRILNAPAQSSNMEMDASRRLLIDTQSLLPARLEVISGVAADEYVLDLVVKP